MVTMVISATNIDKNEDNEMMEESNPWLPCFYCKLNQETLKNIELHDVVILVFHKMVLH